MQQTKVDANEVAIRQGEVCEYTHGAEPGYLNCYIARSPFGELALVRGGLLLEQLRPIDLWIESRSG